MQQSDAAQNAVAPSKREKMRLLLVALPVSLVLVLAIFFSTSSYMHSQLLHLGQSMWDGYSFLRYDIQKPSCDANVNVDEEVERLIARAKSEAKDSLLAPRPPNRDSLRRSLNKRLEDCQQRFKAYDYNQQTRQSTWVRAYTGFETSAGELNEVGLNAQKYLLILLVLFCGIISTLRFSHISLRAIQTRTDQRVSSLLQLVGNGLLFVSTLVWRGVAINSGDTTPVMVHNIWVLGFGLLTAISLWHCFRSDPRHQPGGSIGKALLTVPLYTIMALVCGAYFLLAEQYPSGLAVQLGQLVGHANLYISVGLYVWVGMLLKQTRLAKLVFDMLRPWKMAPELIVVVVVLLAAFPTAFTGASGIFVIAVGAIIYEEIRLSGARRSLAFASTAMSGSMGVVLNPCLMVVVIAALNKEVTTTELYGMGSHVFILSAALFSMLVLMTRRNPLTFESPKKAAPAMLKAALPLIPYALIALLVLVFYNVVIAQHFNEFSAPTILPAILLFLLMYDVWASKKDAKKQAITADKLTDNNAITPAEDGFWDRVLRATSESSTHIGALLLLMSLSVVIGGVVQRAELMALFPEVFSSIWVAMTFFVVIMVIIGMIMDPYGAIIMVSATIASVAYKNGIHPVHFWMMVLTAFELGYLTPPVALNQLLTRQVIGNKEMKLGDEECRSEKSFWYRHERLLLPMAVMASALVLVAYVPLLLGWGY